MKFAFAGAGLLMAALSVMPLAASAADFKLGYVNTERIFREAAPAVAIQRKLEKEFAPRRDELKKMEARAKDLETQLARSNLPTDDRKKYDREYASLDRDYRARARELAEDYNQRRNEEFASIQERANRIVKQIAEKDQYDLILQDSVYVNPKYDLTSRILKELEK
ncbi:OmpH family outer membrane protein [Neisseriaceae bacterium JH1-16]|nr:OmpH family outer membrane protein [Neisseriaceae bacterium JH1-16]